MPNLVSASLVRAQIPTRLSDSQLDAIIGREEAALIERYGAHYMDANTPISESHVQEEDGLSPPASLFLRRAVLSVSSVSEKTEWTSSAVALAENTDYVVVAGQGWLVRLGGAWGRVVSVSYVPQDDRTKRSRIVVELVRLALARTAYQSENIAGEYSYQASSTDWDVQRARLLAQAGFPRA